MIKNLFFIFSLLILSSAAFAGEYKCQAPDLNSSFVFDDGPGGLDYFKLSYKYRNYADVIMPDSPAGTLEGTDGDDDAGNYTYEGETLAWSITGSDGARFVFNAVQSSDNADSYIGTVKVTIGSSVESANMTCTHL